MFFKESPRYKELLPPYYDGIAEIEALDAAIKPQLEALARRIDMLANGRFVELTDAAGVRRWENILSVASPIKSNLTARRNAVKAKLMAKPPITVETLRAVIETYLGVQVDMVLWTMPDIPNWHEFGRQGWGETADKVWSDYLPAGTPYTIDVYYRGFEKLPDLRPLYKMIYELVPAHILVRINYKYATWHEAQEQHPTWQDMSNRTWDYIKLGVWLNA